MECVGAAALCWKDKRLGPAKNFTEKLGRAETKKAAKGLRDHDPEAAEDDTKGFKERQRRHVLTS